MLEAVLAKVCQSKSVRITRRVFQFKKSKKVLFIFIRTRPAEVVSSHGKNPVSKNPFSILSNRYVLLYK